MNGIATDLIVHNLGFKNDVKSIKQKLRKINPTIALMIKEKLQKLLDVKFIQPIDYSKWISNMVSIKKTNRKICIYIDFRDLNKVYHKDDFSLINIDNLVDAMVGHEMLSLMDEFFNYNQIKVASKDQHKTMFITSWKIFCYKVMLFDLKNAGATYQRAMTYILKNYKQLDVLFHNYQINVNLLLNY